jgi:AraC-like DNA-binding protein
MKPVPPVMKIFMAPSSRIEAALSGAGRNLWTEAASFIGLATANIGPRRRESKAAQTGRRRVTFRVVSLPVSVANSRVPSLREEPLHDSRFCVGPQEGVVLDVGVDGEKDLTSLALDLGFSSHSHLTDAFRREFGTGARPTRMFASLKYCLRFLRDLGVLHGEALSFAFRSPPFPLTS